MTCADACKLDLRLRPIPHVSHTPKIRDSDESDCQFHPRTAGRLRARLRTGQRFGRDPPGRQLLPVLSTVTSMLGRSWARMPGKFFIDRLFESSLWR